MKVFSTLCLFIFSAFALQAQTQAKPAAVKYKTLRDSASYSLGYNIGQSLLQRYSEMDVAVLTQAIKDAFAKKNSVIDVNLGQTLVQRCLTESVLKKAAGNKAEGAKFCAANKNKKGVMVTASGLQYEVIKMGEGAKPIATDVVKVNYSGTLINGTEFDNSTRHGGPAQFGVGGVIPGWTEALQLMPVGSKFKLFIPSNLAYGDSEMGTDIQPGATLIFVVELLEIVKPAQEAPKQ
jgi:FKBP-type peptidyl-prolyl cis-trans isomerase FklB